MPEATKRRTAKRASEVEDRAADAVFAAVLPVVDGIAATFGRKCEVVLHDYRKEDHSVIAVSGNVTGREVGSPMSSIGLALRRQGDAAESDLNYVTRTPDGRVIKSSTILLRTPDQHVVGALCINFEVTELRALGRLVGELAGELETPDAPTTTFSKDIESVIETVITEIEDELGHPVSRLTISERTEVFRMLDERGIFQVRRAIPLVAERLGLSRATVYNYISRSREESDPQVP
ncbi:helix-turn-helix transcriptional regulator [Kribbella sp. GL6]|uniref:helix-turn-helix transcriptional regulator n=1 Tax=Kribbella sp. GL6 TaxID=3419765 RepID=UPI003D010D59